MTRSELPNDVDHLKELVLERERLVAERDEWLAERETKIKELQSQLAYLKRMLFGRRGEKIDPQQLLLFNELQAQADAIEEELEQEEIRYTRRKGHGRKPLPDNLPVEEVEYPLEESDCPCCGEPMQTIGNETTDEVDYNPGSLFVRRHIRPKYACRNCEEGVHIAPMPPRPIDKGIAGPGLLAHVLTPIHDDLRAQLLRGCLIQSDDTTVPYLLKSLKKQTATGYLWTYLCESSKLVLYDFTESRGRAGPSRFLVGFDRGTLQSDGYAGYNEIVDRAELTRAGCWAHARRKYYDVRRDDRPRCNRMLKLIQDLFAIERKAKKLREDQSTDFGDAEHLALRHEVSAPLIEKIKACTEDWSVEVLPRSAVGQAVTYMRNQWEPLTQFLDDPQLQLDNNAAERAMRHAVIGRKNWTFAGSAEGGHRAANIYSIVATCREHGLDPFAYLRDVIDRLPRGEDPTALTPAAWKAEQLDRTASAS